MKNVAGLLFFLVLSLQALLAQRTVTPGKNLNVGKNFQPVEGTFATVNGLNMYYEEYGEGEPLILIHDNSDSVRSLNNKIAVFSKRYYVLVADSRGHGRSINPSDSLSYAMIASDWNYLLEQLQIDSAFVVGEGDGAIIGMLLALYYPDKVKKLGVMGARISSDTSALIPEAINWMRKEIRMYSDSIEEGKLQFRDELQRRKLLLDNPGLEPELLQEIDIPVLMMSGDRDMVRLEHTLFIYSNLPNGQLCIFPAATQETIAETPQMMNNQIQRFLQRDELLPDAGSLFDEQ
jgi:pimeloyl-ACP methyl ester carboxylesterase